MHVSQLVEQLEVRGLREGFGPGRNNYIFCPWELEALGSLNALSAQGGTLAIFPEHTKDEWVVEIAAGGEITATETRGFDHTGVEVSKGTLAGPPIF
jgi:hypothetical protein